VLLVSHDRALLDAVGTRTIAIEDRKLVSHMGGWADYVRDREERKQAEEAAKAQPKAASAGKRREGQAAKPLVSKERAKRISALEREVARAEAALVKLEDELADPSAWSSPSGSQRSTTRHAEAKARVESLYEELLTLSDE
jgi:ATP-binding cassette subfamily F protein 3